MSRKPTYGFRCVKYSQRPDDQVLAPALRRENRRFEDELPATPAELESYLAHYEYDATADLNIQHIANDKNPEWPDCRHEIVSVEAAYGAERFDIHLFWPRNVAPPVDAIVWYPGNSAFLLASMDEYLRDAEGTYLLSLVRTGRLVCQPVYKGTLERRYKSGVVFDLPAILAEMHS